MSDEVDSLPTPKVVHRKRIAPIWLLPFLALLVGVWLVWRSLLNSGPVVQIAFESAEGIVVNQTQVRYRGIPLGVVKAVEVNDDLTGVIAEVQFDKKVTKVAEDSQFWLVQPQISLSGISGLSTLMSGNYIGMQPGERDNASGTRFKALKQAPPLPVTTPGLHLTLRSLRAGSIAPGTPIYYRQIPIGSVQTTAMNGAADGITLSVHIQPEYAKLVRKNTRFWNASGVSVSANLTGLKVETESVASLLSGGITMSPTNNGDEPGPPSKNGDSFTLFPDFEAAEAGLRISIRFPSAEGLVEGGTKVMYKGMSIGKVLRLNYQHDTDEVLASVGLDPRYERFVTDKTRFWLVKPQLSVAGVSGLDALLSGAYISFAPESEGQPATTFTAADGPSALDYRAPGLHVLLTASELGSLNQGSPVYYRQLQVGVVQSYTLDRLRDKVDVHVLIDPEHADLVNESTRFWNASGVTLNAGLSGVKFRTESLAALLAGGIAFDTPKKRGDEGIKGVGNGYRYSLFRDEASARARKQAQIRFTSADGLVEGQTRVVYRGLRIGIVEKVKVADDFGTVEATVGFEPGAEHLLTEATAFWLVKPEISVSRIAGLDALFNGTYIAIQPGAGAPKTAFLARSSAPPLPRSEPGLHLVLESPDAGALAAGAPVLYRKITVGSVQDVRLAEDGRTVAIHLHIAPEHAKAVDSSSRFWNAGGVEVRGGLGGIRLRTESIAALVAGGIAFDRFPGGPAPRKVSNGERFKLYVGSDEAANAGFPIRLRLASAEGLKLGAPLRYRGLDIGEIARMDFRDNLDGIDAEAMVRARARPLMREGTRIWQVGPAIGLARTAHVDTLLSGNYLALRPGEGEERFEFTVESREPALTRMESGLNLRLQAGSLGSLKVGDPVLFRQLKVGEVIGSELRPDGGGVHVYINIDERYAPLVKRNARFWHASGVRMDVGLFSGVDVRTESLEAIVAGGVAFAVPDDSGQSVAEGASFRLHAEADSAWLRWQRDPSPATSPP